MNVNKSWLKTTEFSDSICIWININYPLVIRGMDIASTDAGTALPSFRGGLYVESSMVDAHSFLWILLTGLFSLGEILWKHLQDISRGGDFHGITPISLIKSYGFYFRVGEIFGKKVISQKTMKLHPHKNFHGYSTAVSSNINDTHSCQH